MTAIKKNTTIKWNKSQLIESDTYVRIFIKSLSNQFPPAQRQEIYFISKLFVDGTVEVANNRFTGAERFFNRGELLLKKAEDGSVMKKMLINIYDRSKSLYYYRIGEHDKAIELIDNALCTNKELEQQGFSFMAFDRFSQYHNLSKIYFSQHHPEKGIAVLTDVISFLMTATPNNLIDHIEGFLENLDQDGTNMRSSLICLLFFETMQKFQIEKDSVVFTARSENFFASILYASENFAVLSKTDQCIKEWLAIVKLFYDKDFKSFEAACDRYVASENYFYGNIPNILLKEYLNYIPSARNEAAH